MGLASGVGVRGWGQRLGSGVGVRGWGQGLGVRATCSFPLAQQRTIELPMIPVTKMARLPLNIARTSITAAQHFISEIAAAVMEVLPNKGVKPPCKRAASRKFDTPSTEHPQAPWRASVS